MQKIVVLDDDGTFCALEGAKIWTITDEAIEELNEGLEPRWLEAHQILSIEWVEDCIKSK